MKTALLLAAPLGLLLIGTACNSDHNLSDICGTPQRAFDIEEASVLQDAQGYWGMHDAVVLEFDPSQLPEGAEWRVRSVEIMPMIGASQFASFRDGQQVSVEVFDTGNPYSTPWVTTQVFRKDELEWEDVRLSAPDSATEYDQKRAWWRFGFEDRIPTTGMSGGPYLVGVVWEDASVPTLGYSNFNRSCSQNWTDYADGFGWVQNTGFLSDAECSWPMLRVNIEVLQLAEECEGQSYSVD